MAKVAIKSEKLSPFGGIFFNNGAICLDNAIYYSLLESCELAGVQPPQWLTHALENLHDDTTEEQLQALLPTQLQKISRITSRALKKSLYRLSP